ncbi:MAG: helix-turn-helix transcriptional regulator [Candidatus Thiodiazotropha sp. (ex Lucina pensylvanica)]|nr:helix-turn-helix transcriptional regulator [Candidatus Thiodiazotropha sp. (ex Lucina pensylvanica)]
MRLKRGLRQSDVAPRLGVNPWTLRNWEGNPPINNGTQK